MQYNLKQYGGFTLKTVPYKFPYIEINVLNKFQVISKHIRNILRSFNYNTITALKENMNRKSYKHKFLYTTFF